jgi:Xaa-Pro aminopeptidase
LVIFSNSQTNLAGEYYHEILYVQEKNPKAELWTGIRLGVTDAKKTLGFENVFEGKDFLQSGINFYSFSNVFFIDFIIEKLKCTQI